MKEQALWISGNAKVARKGLSPLQLRCHSTVILLGTTRIKAQVPVKQIIEYINFKFINTIVYT